MSSQMIKVKDYSEIEPALAMIRQSIVGKKGSEAMICPLICESMLDYMLSCGLSDISVRIRGGIGGSYVEIQAPGERLTTAMSPENSSGDRIETEIDLSILDQYSVYYILRYRAGVNYCRVYEPGWSMPDLREEIYEYYAREDTGKKRKPASVLAYIIKRHRGRFVLSMLIKTVRHTGAVLLPVFAAGIIDSVTASEASSGLPVYVYVLLSFAALAANLICFGTETIVWHSFIRAVETGFRMALVQKIQNLSMKFHSKVQSGWLLSKLISDVQFIGTLIYDRLQDILHLTIDLIVVIISALQVYPPMLLFYLIIVPLMMLVIRSFSKRIIERKTAVRRQMEHSNAAYKEMLGMNYLTRAQGLQNRMYQNISASVLKEQREAESYDRLNIWVNNITYGGTQGFRLLCLCIAALLAANGHISIGSVVLFQSLFEMIISSTQNMLNGLPQIIQGYDSVVSVDEILSEKDVERNGTEQLKKPVRGEIELKNVSFSYENGQTVLDDISLHIPADSCVALIGKSGSGKTTLLNLILGFYTKNSGELLIDGIDVDELDKNSYRKYVALVPQTTVLLSGTLYDNLVYGLRFVSRERVLEVVREVGLQDLINALPDGLNSRIYEDGRNLSGGQRQRIAIARALLRDARIIIIDEATSSLDPESEKQVRQALDALIHRRTVIMVAHRLTTLRSADAIYRIEDGKACRCDSDEDIVRELSEDGSLY